MEKLLWLLLKKKHVSYEIKNKYYIVFIHYEPDNLASCSVKSLNIGFTVHVCFCVAVCSRMTRWARGEKSNKKQEHEASAWNEIQPRQARRTQVNRGNRNGNSRQQSKGKEEDSDVIINPANFDRDAAETSVVAELEKLGGVHSQSETVPAVGASDRTRPQQRRKRKQIKSNSALIDTDLTSQLLQLRREDDSVDREQIDEIINKDQRRVKRRLKRKEAKLEAKVDPFM